MKLRPFELTLVVIFGILMVLALVLLRSYKPEATVTDIPFGEVVIWGTLPAEPISALLAKLAENNINYQKVRYRYIRPEEFNQEFVNALADDIPPDLVFLSHESFVETRGRVQAVPLASFSGFRSTYIDGAEIFVVGDNVYGYPLAVDPLLLYWNRDLFSFSGMLQPPATWEAFIGEAVPTLVVRETDRSIRQPAVALGGSRNVRHVTPILSMLMLQAGSRLVNLQSSGLYKVELDTSLSEANGRPLSTALTFYTNFSTESGTLYTWNDTLPSDREMFLTDRLGLYFGFGSEGKEIEARNPNLNFDVAPVPQSAAATVKRTYGKFYGIFVTNAARNKSGAYTVAAELGSQTNAKRIADAYNFAPVHRSLLLAGTNDTYGRVSYEAAVVSRGWLNPSRSATDEIFSRLIDEVKGDRTRVTYLVGDALKRLEQAY
jgi:ABC-type glycerol-3-phosphate transport system substrate-binding protein